MQHRAACQCGAFTITASAEPDYVAVCNCIQCQRRTGSPFGVGAYFKKTVLTLDGPYSLWQRDAPEGRKLVNHFCTSCGTNVGWTLDLRPDHMGVALGCLETAVGEPSRVVWLAEKHDWVRFPDHWERFERASHQR
jgi:hypothetical protein